MLEKDPWLKEVDWLENGLRKCYVYCWLKVAIDNLCEVEKIYTKTMMICPNKFCMDLHHWPEVTSWLIGLSTLSVSDMAVTFLTLIKAPRIGAPDLASLTVPLIPICTCVSETRTNQKPVHNSPRPKETLAEVLKKYTSHSFPYKVIDRNNNDLQDCLFIQAVSPSWWSWSMLPYFLPIPLGALTLAGTFRSRAPTSAPCRSSRGKQNLAYLFPRPEEIQLQKMY